MAIFNHKFPYSNYHELNLDWIIDKIKSIPEHFVSSVNGEDGAVTIDKTDIGLSHVEDVRQYSVNNPPPYPVSSVNGQTGDVVLPTVTGVNEINMLAGALTITGGVNEITLSDDGEDTITISLHNDVSNKLARSLVTPLVTPTADKLVGVDTSNAQENIGIGNGLELSAGDLVNNTCLYSDVTYYVDSTGSDTNVGSNDSPFATIQKAISIIPKNLNGYTATIELLSNITTNSTINVIRFTGGMIFITGNYTITSSASNVILVQNAVLRILSNMQITGNGSNAGFVIDTDGYVDVRYPTEITFDNLSTAVSMTNKSNCFLWKPIINSNCTKGIYTDTGSQFVYAGITNNATTPTDTRFGGKIYTGAQTSVPNY